MMKKSRLHITAMMTAAAVCLVACAGNSAGGNQAGTASTASAGPGKETAAEIQGQEPGKVVSVMCLMCFS